MGKPLGNLGLHRATAGKPRRETTGKSMGFDGKPPGNLQSPAGNPGNRDGKPPGNLGNHGNPGSTTGNHRKPSGNQWETTRELGKPRRETTGTPPGNLGNHKETIWGTTGLNEQWEMEEKILKNNRK